MYAKTVCLKFFKGPETINPTIAIIGKPNVGKSTLFNRLVGSRKAIVSSVEGVTRDRIYGKMEWTGRYFEVIDTGGYIPFSQNTIEKAVRKQAEIGAEQADFIILLMDSKEEVTSSDLHLAEFLVKSGKNYILAINKIDDKSHEQNIYNFYELGLGEPFPISAVSGRNMGDFLDKVCSKIPPIKKKLAEYENCLNLAIIGMPNVGKSSLMNALLKEEKSIVTDLAGTTRDSVDSYIKYYNQTIRLIDTAGLRKRSKIDDDLEFYSTVRTNRVLQECDIAAVLLDAEKSIGSQDKAIIRAVVENGKGLVIVVNKWDVIDKTTSTMKEYRQEIFNQYKATSHYPILFISIKHNQRVSSVLKETLNVYAEYKKKVKTHDINNFLLSVMNKYPPPAVRGKNLKIKYGAQIRHSPPLFAFFSNYPDLYPIAYKRYLENNIRQSFGFEGVPLKISFRKK